MGVIGIILVFSVDRFCFSVSWLSGLLLLSRGGFFLSRSGLFLSGCCLLLLSWCCLLLLSWCGFVLFSWCGLVLLSWCGLVVLSWCILLTVSLKELRISGDWIIRACRSYPCIVSSGLFCLCEDEVVTIFVVMHLGAEGASVIAVYGVEFAVEGLVGEDDSGAGGSGGEFLGEICSVLAFMCRERVCVVLGVVLSAPPVEFTRLGGKPLVFVSIIRFFVISLLWLLGIPLGHSFGVLEFPLVRVGHITAPLIPVVVVVDQIAHVLIEFILIEE